jgi:deoxyribodipyrimidine photolyase-related protein
LVNVPKSPSRVGYINPKWLEATTGLEPLDNTIRKAVTNAYLMPNERTSIINNLMMLTDIHPIECYKWFMSMLLDAYDWAVQPNVFSLYNFDDMSGMNNQSPIADSNYVLSTSNYTKDLWCDIWDGLFYRFVDRHRAMLANNKTTAFAVKNLVKITPEHRRIINYRAQDFLYSIE